MPAVKGRELEGAVTAVSAASASSGAVRKEEAESVGWNKVLEPLVAREPSREVAAIKRQ